MASATFSRSRSRTCQRSLIRSFCPRYIQIIFLTNTFALLSGCSGRPEADQGISPLLPPPQNVRPKPLDPAKVDWPNPFTQDFTESEVLSSIPSGSSDPFSVPARTSLPPPRIIPGKQAIPVNQITADDILKDIEGLSLEGVSSISGVPKAFVSYRQMSGDVSVGMEGKASGVQPTSLLPLGWRVVSIDPLAGLLVIRKGVGTAKLFVGGQVSAELQPSSAASSVGTGIKR